MFFKLFSDSYFDTGISVTAFSASHFVYLFLIFGAISLLAVLYKNKDAQKRERLLGILAYLTVISYVFDFFVHDFVYGGMNMDKLPFHLCTSLCILVTFVQFNKRLERFLEPVAVLAVIAPLMYLTYPAGIGDAEPWCYQTVQTMFFHGTEMAWGLLTVALGKVRPRLKNITKSVLLLIFITVWAKFGNLTLGKNWFYLEEDAFYIGLVEMGIIPKWSLMILTPLAVFCVVLAFYGLYYAIVGYKKKIRAL